MKKPIILGHEEITCEWHEHMRRRTLSSLQWHSELNINERFRFKFTSYAVYRDLKWTKTNFHWEYLNTIGYETYWIHFWIHQKGFQWLFTCCPPATHFSELYPRWILNWRVGLWAFALINLSKFKKKKLVKFCLNKTIKVNRKK